MNDARIHVVWPLEDTSFFYLETTPGLQPRRPANVKDVFSTIGVVPILSPIEHDEVVLTSDHVKDNFSSRLVSRHFRNKKVYLFENDQYEQFQAYALEWTPEISRLALGSSFTRRGRELDLFFLETVGHSEKEPFWQATACRYGFKFYIMYGGSVRRRRSYLMNRTFPLIGIFG